MLVVKEFLKDMLTGTLSVSLSPGYNYLEAAKYGPDVLSQQFISESDAKTWIETNVREAYKQDVLKYIKHCEMVIINKKAEHFQQLNSLEHCKALAVAIKDNNSRLNVCILVAQCQQHLEKILPVLNNPSHNSSCKNLFNILNYAKEISRIHAERTNAKQQS